MLSQQWRISKNCLRRILEEVAGLIPGQINNDTPCISAPAFWSSHNNPTTSVDNILCPGCISTSCPLPTPNIAPFPEVTWSWLSVPIFFLKTIEKEYPYPTISLLQELGTPKNLLYAFRFQVHSFFSSFLSGAFANGGSSSSSVQAITCLGWMEKTAPLETRSVLWQRISTCRRWCLHSCEPRA